MRQRWTAHRVSTCVRDTNCVYRTRTCVTGRDIVRRVLMRDNIAVSTITWTALCEKVPNVGAHPSFGMTPTFQKKKKKLKKNLKSRCHTKRMAAPVLLLVWQRLRPLRTLLRNATPFNAIQTVHTIHEPVWRGETFVRRVLMRDNIAVSTLPWAALREKVPNVRAHPSFGMTPTLKKKKKINK